MLGLDRFRGKGVEQVDEIDWVLWAICRQMMYAYYAQEDALCLFVNSSGADGYFLASILLSNQAKS